MKNQGWKRKIARILVLALCLTGYRMPVDTRAANVEESGYALEDSDWESKEVVEELDEDNVDSLGNCYTLYKDGWASLSKFLKPLPQNEEGDYILRVPDKVIKEGTEYVVKRLYIQPPFSMEMGKIKFYLGKEVTEVTSYETGVSKEFILHSENKSFIEKEGSLFSADGKKLLHFCDKNYGEEGVYEIPEEVTSLGSYAFCGAKVKEVVLNDNIVEIPWGCFEEATIQRIDLNKVRKLEYRSFCYCSSLEELRIRENGVSIGSQAFSSTALKYLYLPKGTKLEESGIFCSKSLETVLMDEDIVHADDKERLGLGLHLQTIVLSNTVKEIKVTGCPRLRKLYLPDNVTSISQGGLENGGDLTVYGNENSPAADYDDDNMRFESLSGHEHTLEEVTFFQYETWGVKGKYCRECGYATDLEVVDFEEGDRDSMPELLKHPEEKCPEVLSLDSKQRDNQGLIYDLDPVYRTATVMDEDENRPFRKMIVYTPEYVEKDGKRYEVISIGKSAIWYPDVVILSDKIQEIQSQNFGGAAELELGEGVEEIDFYAFKYFRQSLRIRGENPNFKVVDGVLFNNDMTILYKYLQDYKREEYTVPTSVTTICNYAFYNLTTTLDRVYIYNKEHVTEIGEIYNDVGGYAVEIIYLEDDSVVYPEPTIPPVTDEYMWYDEEEMIVELDDDNKDSYGNYYKITGSTLTAQVSSIDLSKYEENDGIIELKIPDKVRVGGRTYTVISAGLGKNTSMSADSEVHLYMGKYLKDMNFSSFYKRVASYVHVQNESFISDQGSLFSKDKLTLYRFYDRPYQGGSYTLPRKLKTIEGYAFSGSEVRGVCFNNVVTQIYPDVFSYSSVERVDLGRVTYVGESAFSHCPKLKEVIFREKGLKIKESAFEYTECLEAIYIPENSTVEGSAFEHSGLNIAVLGEGVTMPKGFCFSSCSQLQMIFLPTNLSFLGDYTFQNCKNLFRVYVPESVTTIGNKCFLNTPVDLYGNAGSTSQNYSDSYSRSRCFPLENHEHSWQEVTFFSFDTWAIKGKYCKECGAGSDFEMVTWEEPDEVTLPAQLPLPGTKCPGKLELGEDNADPNGMVYELNPETMTAKVLKTNRSKEEINYVLYLPETVEKDGEVYTVDSIGEGAVQNSIRVKLPDTIKKLEKNSFDQNTREVVLGSGLCQVNEETFYLTNNLQRLSFREGTTNDYFRCQDGILLDLNETMLYKFCGYQVGEYKIPPFVRKIMGHAFDGAGSETGLTQVDVTLYEDMQIHEDAFYGCDAVIQYITPPTPSPTASPSPSPTVAPTETPGTSASPSPTASPTVAPTETPEVSASPSPTASPSPAPSVGPTQKPEESMGPSPAPSVGPTVSPSANPTASPSPAPSVEPTVSPSPSPSVGPTQKPEESMGPSPSATASPTVVPTETPEASPSPAPSVGPTQKPEETESPSPSASPTVAPTETPEASPSPTASPTVAPTETPEASASPSPTVSPSPAPSVGPTQKPEESMGPSPSATASPMMPEIPQMPQMPIFTLNPTMAPVQTPAVVEKMAKLNLHITDFHLAADEEKGIVLTWKRCKDAEMYQIYRASKKKGTYHMIQAVSGGKTKYVDEKAKSEKCYYYKIRALGNSNGERQ